MKCGFIKAISQRKPPDASSTPQLKSVNALVQPVEGGHRHEGGGAEPSEPPPPEPPDNSNATAEDGKASAPVIAADKPQAASQRANESIQTSPNVR